MASSDSEPTSNSLNSDVYYLTLAGHLEQDIRDQVNDLNLFNQLSRLDYQSREYFREKFPEEFQLYGITSHHIVLAIKYMGMGHYHLVMMRSTRTNPCKYYITVVGGSEDHMREINLQDSLKKDRQDPTYHNLHDIVLWAYLGVGTNVYSSLKELQSEQSERNGNFQAWLSEDLSQ